MSNKQQGFTLIELVVVIVILGILAAVAVPRFVSLQGDARLSVLRGVEASMRSTSAMIHAKALATGQTGATGLLPAGSVEGIAGTVDVVFGYPATATVNTLLNLSPPSNFITTTAGTVQVAGAATAANCQVQYAQPTVAGNEPVITVSTGTAAGCN